MEIDIDFVAEELTRFNDRCAQHREVGIPLYQVIETNCLKSLPGYWYCPATGYYLPPTYVEDTNIGTA